jgi:uncharacterized protein (UPF0332 family)
LKVNLENWREIVIKMLLSKYIEFLKTDQEYINFLNSCFDSDGFYQKDFIIEDCKINKSIWIKNAILEKTDTIFLKI